MEDGKAAAKKPEIKVPCEVYSRIVGYLRPVSNWNESKQHEFHSRVLFDPDKMPKKPEG